MPDTNMTPIVTPMKLQMRRFRYTILPIAIFIAALIATICLWKNQVAPHGSGEVNSVSVKVYAPLDGPLAATDEREYPRLFDHVTANDKRPIARIKVEQFIEQQAQLEEQLAKKQNELDEVIKELGKPGLEKAKADALKQQEAPLRKAIDELKSTFAHAGKKLAAAQLKVPVDGTITAIHRQPGEFVKQGQEIMTITQDTGGYIVSYVRPSAGIMPEKNWKVTIRTTDTNKSAMSRVQEVGTQVQPIPEHQLMNPNKPEWGIPVRIAMPDNLPLRPGEIVVLNYEKGSK